MRLITTNKKGSALVYALIIMMAVTIILVSMLKYISSQLTFSFNRGEKEQSFQIAEAGIYWYRWYLAHEVSGRTAAQIKDFWQTGNPYGVNAPYIVEYSDPEAGPVGEYKIEVQPPDVNSTIVIVKSTGWTYKDPSVIRTIQVRFRRPSWSEYTVLANDVMRFGPGTQIFGKIHSNNGIRMDGTAYNVVSSAIGSYDDPDHNGNNEFAVHTHVNPPPGSGINDTFRAAEASPSTVANRADVFQAGRQFPVPAVDFNGVLSDLSFMKTESKIAGHGLYFDNSNYGRHIIFKNNGTMDVKKVTAYDADVFDKNGNMTRKGTYSISTESSATSYTIPSGGIIFVEDNVWIEGTVKNKKVTVVAADLLGGAKTSIYVGNNNLLYTYFDGRDIIGLIAQKDIEVIKNSLDNLTIDAALLAQTGRVGRAYYSSINPIDHKSSITINGSMATDLRYGFAYTDGTGYTNRILNFDNNLLYYPPPYFPTGTEYSIDLWEEL